MKTIAEQPKVDLEALAADLKNAGFWCTIDDGKLTAECWPKYRKFRFVITDWSHWVEMFELDAHREEDGWKPRNRIHNTLWHYLDIIRPHIERANAIADDDTATLNSWNARWDNLHYGHAPTISVDPSFTFTMTADVDGQPHLAKISLSKEERIRFAHDLLEGTDCIVAREVTYREIRSS